MSELFATGRILDLILILVLLEAPALLMIRRITGRGPRLGELLPTLISGALLLLAVRAALADVWWGLTALPLAGALVAHLVDLARRWD